MRVVLRLTGIRKGFKGVRLPEKTAAIPAKRTLHQRAYHGGQ